MEYAEQLFDLLDSSKRPLMFKMLELFLQESKKSMDVIVASWENKEFEVTKRSAHKLKGMAYDVGARDFAELCQEVEIGRSFDRLELLESLKAHYSILCSTIEKFLL